MPRAFVFDAYGTLFDVHAAIGRHRDAAGPDADRFSEVWRAKQLEYAWMLTLAGHYAYFRLDAFPDARAALTALRASGLRTAILSNGSPRMLAGAVEAAGLASDL